MRVSYTLCWRCSGLFYTDCPMTAVYRTVLGGGGNDPVCGGCLAVDYTYMLENHKKERVYLYDTEREDIEQMLKARLTGSLCSRCPQYVKCMTADVV